MRTKPKHDQMVEEPSGVVPVWWLGPDEVANTNNLNKGVCSMADMDNVKMTVKGNKLTIEIDLSKEFGLSPTGKTIRIASSLGGQKVPGDSGAVVSLNVYKKPA